jgi:hypothetical protein
MPKAMKPEKRRTRRTPEQQIADLQAEIERVKRRAEQKKAKRDPTLRHVNAAVRSIDKALKASSDVATRTALNEARATLAACLAMNGSNKGILFSAPRRASESQVLEFLKGHPGSRSESIAQALGTDTAALRPALQSLRAESKARAEGQGRATRYYVTE